MYQLQLSFWKVEERLVVENSLTLIHKHRKIWQVDTKIMK